MNRNNGFEINESDKLLRRVRVFEAKRDLPLTKDSYISRKGDLLEEHFDKPNHFENTNPDAVKIEIKMDIPWLNKNLYEYKGTIPAEESKYFKDGGLSKIGKEKERKEKAIAKANDRIAEINYFLNL